MSDVKEIYDPSEIQSFVVDVCDSIVDAVIINNYIERKEAQIKWLQKKSRIACELIGDNVVSESMMYEDMNDDA